MVKAKSADDYNEGDPAADAPVSTSEMSQVIGDLESRIARIEAILNRLAPHVDKIIETAHRFS